jgi:hypothetical protein
MNKAEFKPIHPGASPSSRFFLHEKYAWMALDEGRRRWPRKAVIQLLYLETVAAKWLFSQEKATSHDICKGMRIVEPL